MKPVTDTNWITKFGIHVTSNANKVFANGRHQLEISVSVTPKAGVDITDEQLDSIRLVTLDDNGAYQDLSGELHMSTERDARFEYFADTGSAPAALLEANARRRRFYVSSTRSGGTLDVIYAAITKDESTHYVSHTSLFNTSVTIETLTPLNLTRDDFSFKDEDNHYQEIGATEWNYDVYQLVIKGRQLKLVDAIPYGPKSGEAYFQNVLEEDPGWDFDGLTPHISKSFTHIGYEVSDQTEFPVPNAVLSVNRLPNSMLFIRILTYGTTRLQGVTSTDTRWGLLDQYGNEHKIKMTQRNDGQYIDFVMIE
ncbi:hypothetical protein ACIQAL_20270 [Pseudomonas sp. NPDC088368]|jgi:hypothetical protein|uniref:hypothetical protein n=1 Tax=Pseudomonas sp. NPDC088368 TaxID=3364453 RepID=UPI0038184EF7